MTRRTRVLRLIADQAGVPLERVTPEATLTGDLGFDSLDSLELQMALEEELERCIEDAEVAELHTVAQVLEFVERDWNQE